MYGIKLLENMAESYADILAREYSDLYDKNLMPKNEESKAYLLLLVSSKLEKLMMESYPEVYADYKSRE